MVDLLIGNVVGLYFLQDRFKLIPLNPKNYFMSYVPIVWDWPTILALNGATILLIALVLWIPTIVVNRIQSVKALSFKSETEIRLARLRDKQAGTCSKAPGREQLNSLTLVLSGPTTASAIIFSF